MRARTLKIGGTVLLIFVILAVGAGFLWFKTVSRLSETTVSMFGDEIASAVKDSTLVSDDAHLFERLQQTVAVPGSSVWGRSLGVGVGMVSLLRRSINDEDREDIAQVTSFLDSHHSDVRVGELGAFQRAHPRIATKLREFRELWKRRMAEG